MFRKGEEKIRDLFTVAGMYWPAWVCICALLVHVNKLGVGQYAVATKPGTKPGTVFGSMRSVK